MIFIGCASHTLAANYLPEDVASNQRYNVPVYYLLKTEPSAYSFADLQRDKTTVWDGVTNPVAVRNLREMPKGSNVVIYHTGDVRQAVGTATVQSVDAADPKKPLVTLKVGKALKSPKSLSDIKAQKIFRDSPLVTIGRLSVVPLTEAQFHYLTD